MEENKLPLTKCEKDLSTNENGSSISNELTSKDHSKPPFSNVFLISMCVKSKSDRLVTVSEIYNYYMTHFPYFRTKNSRWKNTIRHTLSCNDCFIKVSRTDCILRKGNYWTLHPGAESMFRSGCYLRRKNRFTLCPSKVLHQSGSLVPSITQLIPQTPNFLPYDIYNNQHNMFQMANFYLVGNEIPVLNNQCSNDPNIAACIEPYQCFNLYSQCTLNLDKSPHVRYKFSESSSSYAEYSKQLRI